MRAVIVFALVPMLIGFAAAWVIREVKPAFLVAAIASIMFVFTAARVDDSEFAIGWLASLLVLPLPVACAIATVAFFAGRGTRHRHRGENGG